MRAADSDLIALDPDIPGLVLALDEHRLRSELQRVDRQLVADRTVAVRRVRYKPGVAVLASVEVVHPELPSRWFRLAAYRRGHQAKLHKELRSATVRGGFVAVGSGEQAWCLVDTGADRYLRPYRLNRYGNDWNTIAYNPSRRLVATGVDGVGRRVVAKVYRRGHPRLDPRLRQELLAAGVALPQLVGRPSAQRKDIEVARHVDGPHPDPLIDGAAVAATVSWLHTVTGVQAATSMASMSVTATSTAASTDRDALNSRGSGLGNAFLPNAYPLNRNPLNADPLNLADRSLRALETVMCVLPSVSPLVHELATALTGALATEGVLGNEWNGDAGGGVPIALIHGDLSPDQVIMRSGDATPFLLDLDMVTVGPIDWDAATWYASQIAAGAEDATPLPGTDARPLMIAAALAIRSTEPFQRRRKNWDLITKRMLQEALVMAAQQGRGHGFQIRRAWPSDRRVALELLDTAGVIVPGTLDRPSALGAGDCHIGDHGVDPALPAMADLVAQGGVVIGHRFGRRAVLRVGDRYAKILRVSKLNAAVAAHRRVERALEAQRTNSTELRADSTELRHGGSQHRNSTESLDAGQVVRQPFSIPTLVDVDSLRGVMWFEAKPGHPVLDVVESARVLTSGVTAGWLTGAALRRFSELEIDELGTHDAQAEIETLRSWYRSAEAFSVLPEEMTGEYRRMVDQVCADLGRLRNRTMGVSHRDFHDGQVLLDLDSLDQRREARPTELTFLDLDTVTFADVALDAGNFLAHMDLAVHEGRLTDSAATDFAHDFLVGRQLDQSDLYAVETYRRASALRIVAVHAFRPLSRPAALDLFHSVVDQQAARATQSAHSTSGLSAG